jgi:hypothetical protein
MNAADFDELSDAEKTHFYRCSQCGEMVDRRQLDDVLFHETDHKPRPHSIRRLGQNRRMNAQCSTHVYEVRPRKDHRRVDLISDALPFSRLWYGEPNAISNAKVFQPVT